MNLADREPKIRGVLLRNGGKADAKRPKQQLRLFHLLIGDSRRQQHLGEAIFTAVFDGESPTRLQSAWSMVMSSVEMPAQTMSLPSSA